MSAPSNLPQREAVARIKEQALELKLRELIREQSEGEWDDATINADARKFTEALAPFLDLKGSDVGEVGE